MRRVVLLLWENVRVLMRRVVLLLWENRGNEAHSMPVLWENVRETRRKEGVFSSQNGENKGENSAKPRLNPPNPALTVLNPDNRHQPGIHERKRNNARKRASFPGYSLFLLGLFPLFLPFLRGFHQF